MFSPLFSFFGGLVGDVLIDYVTDLCVCPLQLWGFEKIECVRRHVRRAVITKGDDVIYTRIVYDQIPQMMPSLSWSATARYAHG